MTAGKSEELSYAQLEQALREQVRRHPDLLLARVMLLELYFKAGRREAFVAEARKLHRRVDNPEGSLEWQRCASMGRLLDPRDELFRSGSSELLVAAQAATAAAVGATTRRFGEGERHAACFARLAAAYDEALKDRRFLADLDFELLHAAGRPSSLQHLRNLSAHIGGAQIYIKREDLAPRNTHSTMMVAGQALLARRLGCKSLVTSTINGCRGLTTAAMAAQLDLDCVVYMDARDSQRHFREVFRMSLMEADLQMVDATQLRNRDVREAALEHWSADSRTFMVTGLDAVPDPYPAMHREFIAAIGRECRRQVQARARRAPDVIVTRGNSTTDALGLFPPFIGDVNTRLVCVEPAGTQPVPAADDEDADAAPLSEAETKLAPDVVEGLRYPSVEREHAWLKGSGRVEYVEIEPDPIRETIADAARLEGVVPTLSTAAPLAWACAEARRRDPAEAIVVLFCQEDDDLLDIGRLFGVSLDRASPA